MPLGAVARRPDRRRVRPTARASTVWTCAPAPRSSVVRTTADGVARRTRRRRRHSWPISSWSASASTPTWRSPPHPACGIDNGIVVDAQGRTGDPARVRRRRRRAPLLRSRRSARTRRALRQRQQAGRLPPRTPCSAATRSPTTRTGSGPTSTATTSSSSGTAPPPTMSSSAAIVDDLDFTAFYLDGGIVRGAFAIDRGEDVMVARELLGRAESTRQCSPTRTPTCGICSTPRTMEVVSMIEGANFIDGAGCPRRPGRTFERRNPADPDDVSAPFPPPVPPTCARRSTRSTRRAPEWAATSPERRAAILEIAAAQLEARADAADRASSSARRARPSPRPRWRSAARR